MFNELRSEDHLNYKVLLKYLNHWFHEVESAKTDATMFQSRIREPSRLKRYMQLR